MGGFQDTKGDQGSRARLHPQLGLSSPRSSHVPLGLGLPEDRAMLPEDSAPWLTWDLSGPLMASMSFSTC